MTVDEARGIVYMPFGGPAANLYGGDRKGANLYGNALVAVDALTGKLKWYFQTIHHDIWDWDLPPAPGLIDVVQNGKTIPALAQATKSGWMFLLDRVTGQPVFGLVERPVPRATCRKKRVGPPSHSRLSRLNCRSIAIAPRIW